MRGNLKFFPVFLCFILITGTPFGSLGAGPPSPPLIKGITGQSPPPPGPATPPGNDGLLSGMTPGNYMIPSGWSVVITQDFESNSLSGSEDIIGNFTSVNRHSGNSSMRGYYAGDADSVHWMLKQGGLGSFSEVYLSFYEYIEPQARFNDEIYLAEFKKTTPGGIVDQEIIVDWLWVPDFNSTTAYLYFEPQSNTNGYTGVYGGVLKTVPVGSWVQYEVHYRPNTPGNNNGFARVYKDGKLWLSTENANLNGSVDMTNMEVMAGGTYTKLTWVYENGSCSPHFGSWAPGVTDIGPRVTNFDSCYCANNCPPDGKVPKFYRYLDDIIILKK